MGKAADPADIFVLFFPAGANFFGYVRVTRNMMQVQVLSALATGGFSTILSVTVVLSVLSRIGKICH